MFGLTRSRLTYANIVATIALFLALGGTSYALVVNGAVVQDESLTDADIRDGSLDPAIAQNAITDLEVADGSLRGADVAAWTRNSQTVGGGGSFAIVPANGCHIPFAFAAPGEAQPDDIVLVRHATEAASTLPPGLEPRASLVDDSGLLRIQFAVCNRTSSPITTSPSGYRMTAIGVRP